MFTIFAYTSLQNSKKQKQKEQFNQSIADKETKDQIYQGNILKKSKYLSQWRVRHVMLTKNYILTFKPGKQKGTHYTTPTELIPLKSIENVCKINDEQDPKTHFAFHIYGLDKSEIKHNFTFSCQSQQIRDKWIKKIKYNCPNLLKK